MVLRSNVMRRVIVDTENTPPVIVKPRASRIRASYDPNRKRRTRTIDAITVRTPRYLAEQAKRKDGIKSKSTTTAGNAIRFNFTKTPAPSSSSSTMDIEMKDAPPQPSMSMTFPRKLLRPVPKAVSVEAIAALDPGLAHVPVEYIKDVLTDLGPGMLASFPHVRPVHPDRTSLQAEMDIEKLPEHLSHLVPPSHMLAIHPSNSPPGQLRRVTLFPAHSAYLASYCANIPHSHFKAVTKNGSKYTADGHIRIPTVPLCLPAPEQFKDLLYYFYMKNTMLLLSKLLPYPACGLPSDLETNRREQLPAYATHIGRTLTAEVIIQHIMGVRSFWLNVVALGVTDERLWDTIDLAWDVLLTALSISYGKPQFMISSVETVSS